MSEDLSKRCNRCRKRQVRCDYGTPGCRKCKADGFECPGYPDIFRIVSFIPSMTRKNRLKNRLICAGEANPPILYSPNQNLTTLRLFDALHHFRIYVAPNVRPGIWPLQSLNLDISIPWLAFPPFFQRLHALVFQSWNYSVHRSRPTAQSELYKQRGLCMSELHDLLKDPKIDRSRIALTSALMLLESDLTLETKDWQIHYRACTKFLSANGGFEACLTRQPDLQALMIRFMLIDIFSSTTVQSSILATQPFDIYKDYLDLLPGLQQELVTKHIPIPSQLLSAIARTNILRTRPPTSCCQHNSILDELLSFDPDDWVATISTLPLPNSPESEEQLTDSLLALSVLAQCYKHAATLYHLFSLSLPFSSLKATSKHTDLIVEASTNLSIYSSKILSTASSSSLRKLERHTWSFLAWPLFVSAYVSMLTQTHDRKERDGIGIENFELFAEKYRTSQAKEASEALRGLYGRALSGPKEGQREEWGGHFDGIFRFAV